MLPFLGALVLQAAYGAVDLLVVGRFGTTSGLSAVSTGSQVLNLVDVYKRQQMDSRIAVYDACHNHGCRTGCDGSEGR